MIRRLLAILGISALGVVAIGSIAYAVRTARSDSADLERRAEEVGLFRQKSDPYDDRGRDNTYPPSALPVFTALMPTASSARRLLWIALNLAALATTVGLFWTTWGRGWPTGARAAFGLTIVASKPVRAGIALGQFHLIPLAMILGAEACLVRGHRIACGLLCGFALIKPTMAAPYLVLLVVRRQTLAAGIAIAVQGVLTLISSLWLGIGPSTLIEEWLRNARSQQTSGTIDLPSLLPRLPPSSSPSPVVLSLTLLLAAGLIQWSLRHRSSLGLTSLATFFAAVMTYHRHYDMVLLIPTLGYLLDRAIASRSAWRWLAVVIFGLALILPSHGRFSLVNEAFHDRVFVIVSYAILILLLRLVATERPSLPIMHRRPRGSPDGASPEAAG